ncbi:MAG: universal stress protein [Chlorobium sp.]|jgi:nucleotide-binding universal stress UspA family protein|uniref:universal stress protein n=1 Tax=Chlorobium sp. TaxID=1095 RepID=UPI001DE4FBA6|nr:universal stress protein [Chlorobium sp.]MBN1279915.1 universal stress protein [Chlorobiaceae bacterium]MCF8216371.1 universal stress protein [Chlorobium sp.]MCF8271274.1 universal stress protein [Chlorobium sp.]MCF8287648.1 universal stress protein [Chlorobium sp.]MCF8291187.1 universal stress protein [Chlorobium sp.]
MENQLKSILCAVDFSALSDHVVAYAADLQHDGTELTLLYVEPEERNSDSLLKKHLHAFSRYSDILASRGGSALFTVRYGDPATGILSYAEKHHADLLVLGSHGSMAYTRLLMGSTAETVMRKATCAVVIYKSPVSDSGAKARIESITQVS